MREQHLPSVSFGLWSDLECLAGFDAQQGIATGLRSRLRSTVVLLVAAREAESACCCPLCAWVCCLLQATC